MGVEQTAPERNIDAHWDDVRYLHFVVNESFRVGERLIVLASKESASAVEGDQE